MNIEWSDCELSVNCVKLCVNHQYKRFRNIHMCLNETNLVVYFIDDACLKIKHKEK